VAIKDRDLRWLLEGMLKTTAPELAEHRGFARALATNMGRTRGRKPGRVAKKLTKKR